MVGISVLFSLFLLIVLAKYNDSSSVTPFLNDFLDDENRASLQMLFKNVLSNDDLQSIHYGAVGLKILGVEISANQNKVICDRIQKADIKDVDELYDVAGAAAVLKSCPLKAINTAEKLIQSALKNPNSKTIYQILFASEKLNMKTDSKDMASLLSSALSKDDSSSSLAYALNAATFLDQADAEQFFVRVEDLIGQADEISGIYLHLEGGLWITAFGVHGIYMLADKLNKSPNVKSDETVKLANYLLSRRNAQMPRGAYYMLITLKKLANNNFQIPVVFSLASKMTLIDTDKPLQIRVSNVLGGTVGPLSVNLDAATHIATKAIAIIRQPLKRVDGDKTNTLYEVDIRSAKERGFYNLALTAGSQDKRVVGTNGASLKVNILAKVRIEDISVAVFDRELSKPTSTETIKESAKLGKILEADSHSKMEIKFKIKEAKTGSAISVHQAFIAFVHSASNQEIIFVATPDHSNSYTFDVDFDKSAKDFDGLSGKYAIYMIIGDASLAHAFNWNLMDLNLKLHVIAPPKIKKSEQIVYEKLPEIKHTFHEPEKRPSNIVSNTFTVLCIIPLFILLILWLRIGINFGNMPLSPFILLFHGSLTGIFVLYMIFWLRLDMFTTLKYLSVIGAFTFLSGNRLLRAIADKRKEKPE